MFSVSSSSILSSCIIILIVIAFIALDVSSWHSLLASFSYLHHCLHFAQLHHKLHFLHFLTHGCYPTHHCFYCSHLYSKLVVALVFTNFLNFPYLHLCPHFTHPYHQLNFFRPHHICHTHCAVLLVFITGSIVLKVDPSFFAFINFLILPIINHVLISSCIIPRITVLPLLFSS